MNAAYETGVLDGHSGGQLSPRMMGKASRKYLRDYRLGLTEGKALRREEATAYAAILEIVKANHAVGTLRRDVLRSLLDLAPDSREDAVRRAVTEVYGEVSPL